jgi:hypothetical protein
MGHEDPKPQEHDFSLKLTRVSEPKGGPGVELATLEDAARLFGAEYRGSTCVLGIKPNKKVPTVVSSLPQVGTKQSALRTKGHETFSRRQVSGRVRFCCIPP